MKFYKVKNAKVGQEVEATVIYHKDNGEELICVREDSEAFEKQNPKAKECSKEDADKLLKKTKVKLTNKTVFLIYIESKFTITLMMVVRIMVVCGMNLIFTIMHKTSRNV